MSGPSGMAWRRQYTLTHRQPGLEAFSLDGLPPSSAILPRFFCGSGGLSTVAQAGGMIAAGYPSTPGIANGPMKASIATIAHATVYFRNFITSPVNVEMLMVHAGSDPHQNDRHLGDQAGPEP